MKKKWSNIKIGIRDVMDNVTLHCQIFDTHPNDGFVSRNSTATMMLSTCMIVQAVLTFQVPLKWQLQT